MESRYQRETNEVQRDSVVHLTDALPTTNAKDGSTRSSYGYNLAVWETMVFIASSANSFTIYLPEVAEAKGKFYSIHLVTANSKTITMEDLASGSMDWAAVADTLTADADRLLYYSDGYSWWLVQMLAT